MTALLYAVAMVGLVFVAMVELRARVLTRRARAARKGGVK